MPIQKQNLVGASMRTSKDVDVLVTVGSTTNDFRRLVAEVDRLRGEGKIGRTFMQVGLSNFEPSYCDFARFVARKCIKEMMNTCRLLICHAGTGTLEMALGLKKKTIVVPRKVEFGEHPDDHQLELAQYLEQKNRALAVYDVADLQRTIELAEHWKPQFSESSNMEFISAIRREVKSFRLSSRRRRFRGVH
jgi:UDP-N-acetylglucosamine transferase subunit ALG13